jgi:polyhydroxybutyrate depolymerase
MKNKIVGICICMLLITTCVIPVMGETIVLKGNEKQIRKNSNNVNSLSSSTTQLKFMIAGKALRILRTYWLHVPPSYDGSEPVPLVIVLHGSTGFSLRYPFWFFRSSWMENYTELSKKADEKGFIVLYPNAKLDFYTRGFDYNYGYVPGGYPKYVDDIGFLRALINKMKQDYSINSSRIYFTGISDGAFMTYSAGAYFSDIVAAIAPVAGMIGCRMNENDSWSYISTPSNPVSVIAFHGTSDSLLPYDGDSNVVSVNESIAFWVQQNGCDPTPEINISESGKIIRRTYTNGNNGTEVILYTTVGGDHWWPGNPLISSPGSPWLVDNIQEISATDLIWEFFEAHPKL